jgi:hypothetical protein
MKKFFTMMIQDLVILTRNWLFYALPFLALVIILLTNFVLPEETGTVNKPAILFYEKEGTAFSNYLNQAGEEDHLFDSKEALVEAVKESDNSIGIVVEKGLPEPVFTVIHQGTESEVIKNYLEMSLEVISRGMSGYPMPDNYKVVSLRPQADPIPFNLMQLPFFIVMEAGILGMMLIVIMVFQEKQEGSIRAYRITPGGILRYIGAKMTLLVFLSTIYAFIIAVFTVGFSYNILQFLIITILGSLVIALIGFATCVFFNDLSEYIFVMIAIMGVIALPVMSYFMPSFSPWVIKLIPAYPMLFGYKEVFFPSGSETFMLDVTLPLIIEGVILLGLTYLLVKVKLFKEGR